MPTTKDKNRKLTILTLLDGEDKKKFQGLEEEWGKYFDFEQIFDKPENAKKYFDKKIDVLFMNAEKFQGHFYEEFHKNNNMFLYNAVKDSLSKKDVAIFQALADRVVYTEISDEYLIWTTIASLRRYWETYSKPSTIIYKDIIADFVENKFSLSGQKIELTTKEVDLLRFLLKNRNKFIDKKTIFKEVWGFEETDATRTVDQMIFKLKRKLGTKYFEIRRNQGVKFG